MVELMLEQKMPDGVVANIMKCLGCMNSSFDAGVYAKYEGELKEYAKYVKKNNWSIEFENSLWGKRGGWDYLYINIDKSMIKQLIKDEISVTYINIVKKVRNIRGVSRIIDESEGYIHFDDFDNAKIWLKLENFQQLRLEVRFRRTYD